MNKQYVWTIIRLIIIGLFAWGGFNEGASDDLRAITSTNWMFIIGIVVMPIVFFSSIVVWAARKDIKKYGVNGKLEAPTWTSNLFKKGQAIHFTHLVGYTFLIHGFMTLVPKLIVSDRGLFILSSGMGLLLGVAIAKKLFCIKKIEV